MKLLIWILLLPISLLAQVAAPKSYETKVSVSVSCETDAKQLVESYIKRELRSLKDVTIVEAGSYHMNIMVVPTIVGEKTVGYAISVVHTHPFASNIWSMLFATKLAKEDVELITRMTTSMQLMDGQELRVCSADRLRQTCESIVAAFDSNTLEPGRKLHNQVRNSFPQSEVPSLKNKSD